MRTLFSLTAAVALCGTISAQGVITRIGSDGHHFYYNGELLQAVADANATVTADTIILGGGTYAIPVEDLIIEQPVVLIGTGPDIDSTAAYNGRTVIDGNKIYLRDGADGSEFHGLTITSNIHLGEFEFASTDVDNLLFSRCDLMSLYLSPSVSIGGSTMANDIVIDNCVIRTNNLNLCGAPNTVITNSVIRGFNSPANGTVFEHCLFLGVELNNGPAGVTFRNNIFMRDVCCTFSVNGASTYVNNLYVGNGPDFAVSYTPAPSHDDIAAVGTSLASVFVNVSSFSSYQYAGGADYQLLPAWQGLADDGTDPGPYGGNGWKEGGIPFNPHWRQLTSPGATVNGVLSPVTIKASAQTH